MFSTLMLRTGALFPFLLFGVLTVVFGVMAVEITKR